MKKGRKVRSMRGEIVDFDLMDIKAQMAAAPKTTDVTRREDYIERRLRRRAKRTATALEKAQVETVETVETVEAEQPPVEDPKNALKEIRKSPVLEVAGIVTEVKSEEGDEPKPRTRRIKKKNEEK